MYFPIYPTAKQKLHKAKLKVEEDIIQGYCNRSKRFEVSQSSTPLKVWRAFKSCGRGFPGGLGV